MPITRPLSPSLDVPTPDPASIETTEDSPSDGPWTPHPPTLGGGRDPENQLSETQMCPGQSLLKSRRLQLRGPLSSPLLSRQQMLWGLSVQPGPSPAQALKGAQVV